MEYSIKAKVKKVDIEITKEPIIGFGIGRKRNNKGMEYLIFLPFYVICINIIYSSKREL